MQFTKSIQCLKFTLELGNEKQIKEIFVTAGGQPGLYHAIRFFFNLYDVEPCVISIKLNTEIE